MENLQTVPFLLGSQAWSAGNPLTFDFKNLPKTKGMWIPHVVALDIEVDMDPTYTTAPTIVGHNNAIKTVSINDGLREWMPMGGSLNVLRAFERLEIGRSYQPEALLGNASTNNRYIRRRFYWNPRNLIGQPSDGAYNTPYLSSAGGKVVLNCGQLTDMSADCTAATGTVRVVAHIARYPNKLIFPPYFPRQMQALVSGGAITQRALYGILGFLNSTSFDALAVGDIGDVTIDVGGDILMQAASSPALTAAHNADMETGAVDALAGDSRDATYDVNARQINLSTPTALAVQAADLQPALWIPKDTRMTKLMHAPSQAIITVSGSGSTTQVLMGRFLPVSEVERGAALATALANLEGRKATEWGLRLASGKAEYSGPLRAFLPWQAKLNNLPY